MGYKLLRADGTSLNGKFHYGVPADGMWSDWQPVGGNGAYVAETDGLLVGGRGPLLVEVEGREPTGAVAPPGVVCYAAVRVRRADWATVGDVTVVTSGTPAVTVQRYGWCSCRGGAPTVMVQRYGWCSCYGGSPAVTVQPGGECECYDGTPTVTVERRGRCASYGGKPSVMVESGGECSCRGGAPTVMVQRDGMCLCYCGEYTVMRVGQQH